MNAISNKIQMAETFLDQSINHFLLFLIEKLPPEEAKDLSSLINDLGNAKSEEEKEEIVQVIDKLLRPETRISIARMEPIQETPNSLKPWVGFVSVKIKEERKKAGLTQDQLEQKAGIKQSHISRLEKGLHSPTGFTLEKIAKALGIDVKVFDPSLGEDE